ncbi:MAG: hypothetical protein VX583_11730 [Bdellovibrionota bacterium]|nr:hypothetical protein [Pseudobdellovibrionaceae bacterium]|tara:strand:- start:32365 stop:32928 length:564 start_codon:yes stop_codon:yes gene_type:complete
MGESKLKLKQQLFDPVMAAQSFFQVSDEVLKTDKQDVMSRWYGGFEGVDFFTWSDQKGNFIKLQLNFCGQIFEWNIVHGIRTGFVAMDEEPAHFHKTESIQYDETAQSPFIDTAVIFIKNMNCLSPEEKQEMLKNIKGNTNIDNMSGEGFWEKFGYPEVKYSESKSLMGFKILWHNVKSFFKKHFSK